MGKQENRLEIEQNREQIGKEPALILFYHVFCIFFSVPLEK
ncbi:hypothetical protein [Thermoactinomyces mirandus]|nr:hypothetical protein [Thermoactinomyces mirandus]